MLNDVASSSCTAQPGLCNAVPLTQWNSQSTAPFFGTDTLPRELGQEEKREPGAIFSALYSHRSISYTKLKKVYIAMERNGGENFVCLLWLYSVLLIPFLQCRTCGQLSSVNQLRTNLKEHRKIERQTLKNSKLD